jgi:hypothetical protein
MTSKSMSVILGLVWAGWSMVAGASPPSTAQAPVSDKSTQRLVRLDLLVPRDRSLKPQRRNIFVAGAEASEIEAPPERPNGRTEGQASTVDGEDAEAGGQASNIQYIGYVLSPRGVIGLVSIDGTTRALAEGDLVRIGCKVTKISRTEVEVEDAAGAKTTYSLKGEEK